MPLIHHALLFLSLVLLGSSFLVRSDSFGATHNGISDFVFGFSTGHVGSTSFSDSRLYNLSNVIIMFEGKYKHKSILRFTTKAKWKSYNHSFELEFVKSLYMPFLLSIRKKHATLMDLGHNNLYFVEALIEYFSLQTHYRATFVRIRRDRYESARSLSFSSPLKPLPSICAGWHYLCPLDRKEDVILHPLSTHSWNTFSIIQQAFWFIDEVEARWQRALKEYPNTHRVEVYWSSQVEGSFDAAASVIGSVLGLVAYSPNNTDDNINNMDNVDNINHPRNNSNSQIALSSVQVHYLEHWTKKVHADKTVPVMKMLRQLIQQDRRYHSLMNMTFG